MALGRSIFLGVHIAHRVGAKVWGLWKMCEVFGVHGCLLFIYGTSQEKPQKGSPT